ncbi:endonuclease/exonuclease/phosphatase family protein [Actinomadura hibisca]|uniref:endonuclease/exonuclease/phosphatase family protein n=1 Tax=Actinomadura hibisca TaxID=68565 RepID=UPI000AE4496F|nr:endonuclease/exonuclease/phosphatase family protein [Actinomadura hibisca]
MRAETPQAEETKQSDPPRRARRRWVDVLVWTAVAPFAVWAALRTTGWEPGFRWGQLVAFTPYVAMASLAAPVLALLLRRWPAALVAALAATLLAAAVLPRAMTGGNPDARGPELRVLASNLAYGQVPAADLLNLVRSTKADVLTLQELTPDAVAALEKAGIAKELPHRVLHDERGASGTGVYARHPLREQPPIRIGFTQTRATMTVPGAPPVEVVSVHPCAPSIPAAARCWKAGLRALPSADPGGTVRVLAGDFNATLDHAGLRRVVGTGYRDAADVAGVGLSTTWPESGPYHDPLPGVALDHVLADRRVAVRRFTTHVLPATDHRAIAAELVLPAA